MNSERSMRHVSHVLTYPLTIGSVLHQASPYRLGKDLTVEGLKSLAGMGLFPSCLFSNVLIGSWTVIWVSTDVLLRGIISPPPYIAPTCHPRNHSISGSSFRKNEYCPYLLLGSTRRIPSSTSYLYAIGVPVSKHCVPGSLCRTGCDPTQLKVQDTSPTCTLRTDDLCLR